jgi:hypothetical protein
VRLHKEDRAGIYGTVIFHLAVLVILLVCQIGYSLRGENSFILDFSKQEEIERIQQEEMFKEDISSRIDELLAASAAGQINVRNIAVDRGALRDDRGTDAQKLYEDAARLQQELESGFELPKPEDGLASVQEVTPAVQDKPKAETQEYQGPSVVSYSLDGRKASHLSIPAYRCMGAGMVTVIITVNPRGDVINAKVQEEASSPDQCLREFAVRAARLSKFSSSTSAPDRQMGDIIYQFIAQ